MVSFCPHLAAITGLGPNLTEAFFGGLRSGTRLRSGLWLALLLGQCGTGLAADANVVLDFWFASQTNLHTWSSDFTQTRALKTLTQPLVATGHLWFATPNRFRWEMGSPAQTIAVRNAEEMFVIYPRLKRAEKYPLGGNTSKEWRDMLSLLDAGFPHDRTELDSRFNVLSI